MDNIKIAYLAGLVDGEGYIGIKKTKPYKNLTGCVNPSYHERIQIRMVAEPAIKLFTEVFGGWYYKEKPHCNNGRPLYCYQSSDKKASEILSILLPYLLVKKESAITVLHLRESKNNPIKVKTDAISDSRWGTPMTGQRTTLHPDMVKQRESYYQRCKELNKVGL
jgi:hypothetical protein